MSKPVAHGPLFDGGPRGQGGKRQLRNFNFGRSMIAGPFHANYQ